MAEVEALKKIKDKKKTTQKNLNKSQVKLRKFAANKKNTKESVEREAECDMKKVKLRRDLTNEKVKLRKDLSNKKEKVKLRENLNNEKVKLRAVNAIKNDENITIINDEIIKKEKVKLREDLNDKKDMKVVKRIKKDENIKNIEKENKIEEEKRHEQNLIENKRNSPAKKLTENSEFLAIFKKTCEKFNIPQTAAALQSAESFEKVLKKLSFLDEKMMEVYSHALLYRTSKGFKRSDFSSQFKKKIFDSAVLEIDQWVETEIKEEKTIENDTKVCNLYSILG